MTTGQAQGQPAAQALVVADGDAVVAPSTEVAAPRPKIPEATAARLAVYLRVLSVRPAGAMVSSTELAAAAGVKPAGLRKDLSFLGSYGTRGVGYDVGTLTDRIRLTLGAHQAYQVALVGLGHLGQALAGYPGFVDRGFSIAALFDADPAKIGRPVAGHRVRDVAELLLACRREGITIGVIATPESAAQDVADTLVEAGVRSILNFAPGVITVPPDVEVRRVDLALELQILAFLQTRNSPDTSSDAAVAVIE